MAEIRYNIQGSQITDMRPKTNILLIFQNYKMEIDDKTLIEELKEKQESCSMNQLQELWAQSAQNKPIKLKPLQADRKEGKIKKKTARRPKGISKIKSEGNNDQNFENPYNSKSLNPWAVENVSVFLKYCCPECDLKTKNGDYFKRHAIECHNQSKVFFITSKSENAFNKDPLELETGSD